MQQHPIPQNVTQYQFRLVGDMTLKQFLELASGLLLAYLFFASNLIFVIKWPLIILSILFGAGLAFFPVEDRPLDQWIINFVKAIYAPTRFIWQKTNKIPRLFLFEAHTKEVTNAVTKTIKAPTITTATKPLSDLSDFETEKINSLESIFKQLPQEPTVHGVVMQPEAEVSKPAVSVRKLSPLASVQNAVVHIPKTDSTTIPKATPSVSAEPEEKVAAPTFTAPSAPKTNTTSPSSTPKSIKLPASPKTPNLVTGVVVDQANKLVENAIVQIVSADGIPARAMKTNALGQFYTSTPLSPGNYVIEVDKTGVSFSPQQIVINDSILSPIELRTTR